MTSRTTTRIPLVGLLAAGLLTSGLAVGSEAATASARPAATTPTPVPRPAAAMVRPTPLRWSAKSCPAEVREIAAELRTPALAECTTMPVPLDRAHPTRGTISLAITRVRSSAPTRATRTLFVNPGGPGVEAGWLAPTLAVQFADLHRSHTIVAVDPRGTGHSTPLDCDVVPSSVTDPRNPDSTEIAALQRATAATVARCAKAHGRILPHISTAETVADLDAVRARLGASSIDWYGASAGTWLGARYAHTHPYRIGRLVLDSTVDLTADWRRSFALQPAGFQRRYATQFIPWVARHHAAYGLGTTSKKVAASIEALRVRAATGRLAQITPVDLDNLIAAALYDDRELPGLAEDLAVLADGASTSRMAAIHREAQEGPDPAALTTAEDTVFMAVQCNDFAWSRTQSSYVAEGRALGRAHPLLGWTWMTSPCATWPYTATPLTPLPAGALPAGLVLQNEMDPATPLEGARRVLTAQKKLRAVVVDDEGSHGVLVGRNTCATRPALTYLTKGVLPRRDLVCKGTPMPGDAAARRVGATLTPASLRR